MGPGVLILAWLPAPASTVHQSNLAGIIQAAEVNLCGALIDLRRLDRAREVCGRVAELEPLRRDPRFQEIVTKMRQAAEQGAAGKGGWGRIDTKT